MVGENVVMTPIPDDRSAAVLARRIGRIRVVVACAVALFFFAVSAGLALLAHSPESRYTNAEKVTLVVAALSAVIFVFVGIILYRSRVGLVAIRAAEIILWLDFVALAILAVVLLATGSIYAVVWIAAIGFGFDLAKQLRQYPPSV
ncbi:hypothetical protein [Nocardia brasiliensis]|uniref:hypothetical protein n=1 Tax=Nocardia brasiliensis TaxID=37326 RepID=UPI0011B266C9|nr:hypothetical protein [Nocardia brasiliensis]